MSVTLSLFAGAGAQFFDNNGNVLSGGKIYTYQAGTTTPLAVYTSNSESAFHTNPIILDAAGRVPSGGEIWLQFGVGYKFVLKTSADVLIATYDNIPSSAQPPAANDADSIMYEQGYTVTAGSFVVGKIYRIASVGTTNFTLIGATSNAVGTHFIATGVGAGTGTAELSQTVEAKLQQTVSVKDFGAVGDGVTDDTAALKAAFDYAIPSGVSVEIEGAYKVSGPITSSSTVATGSLNVICKGNVTITVDPASAAFTNLIFVQSTAANNSTISGGSFTLDLNNKVSNGIIVRHLAASQGGKVHWTAKVTVLNAKENGAAVTDENRGIGIIGDYESIELNDVRVNGVTRTNTSGGACQGITVSEFSGTAVLNNPDVSNVILPVGATADADGISIGGKTNGGTFNRRLGVAFINEPVLKDNQGRQIKLQINDVTIFRPISKRQMVVSISNGVDFDFQIGDGLLIEPYYEYRLNGATSPIGAGFSCVAFQQRTIDSNMMSRSIGGQLFSEVLLSRYCTLVQTSSSQFSATEVKDLNIVALGSLSSTVLDRAIIETAINTAVSKTAGTQIVVDSVRGPVQAYGIGYTDYTSGSLATKLDIQVTNLNNTLASTGSNIPFGALSGNSVIDPKRFQFRNNANFRSRQPAGWTFNFQDLLPGCSFNVDIATVVATNPPGWGASGGAEIIVHDQRTDETRKCISVFVDDANAANTVFYTANGGTVWGTIK